MTATNGLARIINEGKAKIKLPKSVFYNPAQEFNRDLSVFVLRTFLKHNVWHHKREEHHVTSRGGMMLLDALSASGLRSIRYAKELGEAGKLVKKIVANDLSIAAVDLINENIKLNEVSDKVTSSRSDASMLIHSTSASFDDRFHIIDLDPFGTGAQFFDASVKNIGEAGLLMVTCTDTAVLCGNAGESCFARYGSMPLRGEFCHEQALRIILRSLESHAAIYGRYIKPLLSLSIDFYVRLFVQVFSQQAETKMSASKLSQVYLCKECRTHRLNPLGTTRIKENEDQAKSNNLAVKYTFKPGEVIVGDRCNICGGHYSLGGPIWSSPIHDTNFINLLKQELALPETKDEFATFRRMEGMVHMCGEELDTPLFYSLDEMSSTLKMRMPKMKVFASALLNAGYKVSLTHTNKKGLKTDAIPTVVWDILCQICQAQENWKGEQDQLAKRIMSRTRERIYDLSDHPEVEAESKKTSLLRFQCNPEKNWGPKPRPRNKDDHTTSQQERVESDTDCQETSQDGKSSDIEESSKRIKLAQTSDNTENK